MRAIYECNEKFFDVIDTEEKAYWLGFLYADGCIANDTHYMSLVLSISDKEHLIEFNKHIKSTYPIKIEREKYVKLKISNKHIGNSLINKGCIPKKSLILEFPNLSQVPKFLIRHFIRGYFDGDGYVSKNYYNAKLSIVSTKAFCESVQTILHEDVGINASIYTCHKNELTTTRTLQISGRNQIRKFLDYIYNDANLYLQRKYDIYQSLYANHENINNTLAV